MSITKNIISNYVNQIWIAVANLIAVPLYLKTLGVESFGIIAYLISLLGCFSIFDLGFAPIISQESKKYQLKKISKSSFFNFIKTVNIFYFLFSCFIFIGLFLFAFEFESLQKGANSSTDILKNTNSNNFFLIASLMIALRYLESFYRSFFIGLEFFHEFNLFNFVIIFLRNFLPIIIFKFYPSSISIYLYCQIFLSLIVIIFFHIYIHSFKFKDLAFAEFKLKEVLIRKNFIISLFKASFLSVIITQLDKLIVINYVTMEDYGIFSVATAISSGFLMLIAPITQVFYPRLVKSYVQKNMTKLSDDFHYGAQLITLLLGTLALEILFFSSEILLMWTSDMLISEKASPILCLFIFGSLINSFLWVPYQLQIAMKWMRLSLTVNFFVILFMIPLYIIFLPDYGARAAGAIWLTLNLVNFIFSVNFMFNKILRNERFHWYFLDILIPSIFIAGILYFLKFFVLSQFLNSLSLFVALPLIYFLTLALSFWIFNKISIRKILND
jgi:O-antigen/teichoic acid export membrane protein